MTNDSRLVIRLPNEGKKALEKKAKTQKKNLSKLVREILDDAIANNVA